MTLRDPRDDEQAAGPSRRGGSRFGCRFVMRDREVWHKMLVKDYFAKSPIFDDMKFRCRYHKHRSLFLKIVESVCEFDPYFLQRCDGLGQLGLSSLQKCTSAICMLAYGVAIDATDEYCHLGESTAQEGLK